MGVFDEHPHFVTDLRMFRQIRVVADDGDGNGSRGFDEIAVALQRCKS